MVWMDCVSKSKYGLDRTAASSGWEVVVRKGSWEFSRGRQQNLNILCF